MAFGGVSLGGATKFNSQHALPHAFRDLIVIVKRVLLQYWESNIMG